MSSEIDSEPSSSVRQTLPPIHTVLGDQLRLPTSISHSPHSSSSYTSFYTCLDGSEVHPESSSAGWTAVPRSPARARAFTIPIPPIIEPIRSNSFFPRTYSLPTTPVPPSPEISEGKLESGPSGSNNESPHSAPPFSYSILRPSPSGELIAAPQIIRGRRQRKPSQGNTLGPIITRRHVCSICQKTFNRPSSLQTHLSVHTGSRPFECLHPSCTKVFSVASNMRRHFRKHHSQTVTSVTNVRRDRHWQSRSSRIEPLGSSDGENDAGMETDDDQPSSIVPGLNTTTHHQSPQSFQPAGDFSPSTSNSNQTHSIEDASGATSFLGK
ncbi:hypothetical protein Clacol_008352 [Clathrus columnatus]|uniref:C2H2-type domain-containing protein n=1 Tax=Clathrus columnatus TaxID=1419009 RepID=A0AAV5AQC1_9AGAM|nr:hypothetical protein Clacol_008352 [Clathrus columnatus]